MAKENDTVFVMCRRGVASKKATKLLLEKGIKNVVNVIGGITKFAQEVDTTLPIY